MALGATLCVFAAVLAGTLLLADVAPLAGVRRALVVHLLLAVTATAVVCVAALAASGGLAWIGVVAVAAAASAGFVLWRRVSREESRRPAPAALLVFHGAMAGLAALLILIAAARG